MTPTTSDDPNHVPVRAHREATEANKDEANREASREAISEAIRETIEKHHETYTDNRTPRVGRHQAIVLLIQHQGQPRELRAHVPLSPYLRLLPACTSVSSLIFACPPPGNARSSAGGHVTRARVVHGSLAGRVRQGRGAPAELQRAVFYHAAHMRVGVERRAVAVLRVVARPAEATHSSEDSTRRARHSCGDKGRRKRALD